jgi:hypothetical protein
MCVQEERERFSAVREGPKDEADDEKHEGGGDFLRSQIGSYQRRDPGPGVSTPQV